MLALPSGQVFAQSGALARFAAKKAGLFPRDDEAAMRVDELVETVAEFMVKCPQGGDAAAKKAARAEYVASGFPKYLGFFSRRLAASGGPFLTGAALTLADLDLFAVLHSIRSGGWDHVEPAALDAFPGLTAFCAAVRAHELVVKHGKDI